MDVSLDTFLALALIFIGSILWAHMRANDKNHQELRDKLQILVEINQRTDETIDGIDRMVRHYIERRFAEDRSRSS